MFIFINGAVFGFKFLCGWSLCSFYAFLVLLLCNAPSQIDLAEYAHKCIAGKALSLFSISWHGVRCICLSSVVKIILQSFDFVFDFRRRIVDIVIKMNLAIQQLEHNKRPRAVRIPCQVHRAWPGPHFLERNTMNQEQHNLIEVVEFCRVHNLPGEIVGRWVWLRFGAKPGPEVRELIKSYGFRWVNRRGAWAHNCGHYCKQGVGDPRLKYGCRAILADDAKVA